MVDEELIDPNWETQKLMRILFMSATSPNCSARKFFGHPVQRYRSKRLGNWLCDNENEDTLRKYKRGFFVEWIGYHGIMAAVDVGINQEGKQYPAFAGFDSVSVFPKIPLPLALFRPQILRTMLLSVFANAKRALHPPKMFPL